MKNLIFSAVLLFSFPVFSQTNFEWDVIINTPDLTQEEIYARTKLFIGKSWKSAEDVIQSDERDAGQVLVKVKILEHVSHYRYGFKYNIVFLMKDQKARILISDVECVYAKSYDDLWIFPPLLDQYPQRNAKQITGLNEERYLTLIIKLKLDLQQIVNNYKVAVLKYSPEW
tara:strand:- start:26956 stop:27468 length:513 start_codon:yes stop_codon:yes gene_type:complete